MTARLRTAVLAALVSAAPLLVPGTAAAAEPALSSVVFSTYDEATGASALKLVDLTTRRTQTVLGPDANGSFYDDPELSPDGTSIVFSTDRGTPDGQAAIAVVDRDGTDFRRIAVPDEMSDYVAPTWTPDGQRIYFTAVTPPQPGAGIPAQYRPSRVDVDGGELYEYGSSGINGDVDPTGTMLVYTVVYADGRSPLRVTYLNGAGPDGVTDFPLGVEGFAPTWSPDGTTIAFETVTDVDADDERAADVVQIATVPAVRAASETAGDADVLPATRPTAARTVAESPTWAPDGRSLLFDLYGYTASGEPTAGDLWGVDVNGLRSGKVLGTAADELMPSWSGPRPVDVERGALSTFVPVTPVRVLDTRSGARGSDISVPPAPVGPGGTVRVQVAGQQTVEGPVPATATAVVLNVTVTGVSASTDIRAYPSGSLPPDASNINALKGQTVPNSVTVPLGPDGAVVLRNSAGSVALLADLAGYYVPGDGGASFSPLTTPVRWLDTRPGSGRPAERPGPVGPGDALPLHVTGNRTFGNGPPENATAVILNVTATRATASTDVRVYPAVAGGTPVPEVSNLNVRAGETVANLVTVPVGETGFVYLRNQAGSVDLIVDIAGWYGPDGVNSFVPVVPQRFLDTRTGVGAAPTAVGPGRTTDVAIAATRGVPAGAQAAVLNLTATGATASTDVRAYPAEDDPSAVPLVSNLNTTAGRTRANAAVVRLRSAADQVPAPYRGAARLRNAAGSTHLIADLAGYFVPAR